jgi:hypothetical protein
VAQAGKISFDQHDISELLQPEALLMLAGIVFSVGLPPRHFRR